MSTLVNQNEKDEQGKMETQKTVTRKKFEVTDEQDGKESDGGENKVEKGNGRKGTKFPSELMEIKKGT